MPAVVSQFALLKKAESKWLAMMRDAQHGIRDARHLAGGSASDVRRAPVGKPQRHPRPHADDHEPRNRLPQRLEPALALHHTLINADPVCDALELSLGLAHDRFAQRIGGGAHQEQEEESERRAHRCAFNAAMRRKIRRKRDLI